MDRTWGRNVLHSIDELDGVGSVTAGHLAARGLGTIEEFASQPKSSLAAVARQIPGISAREVRDSLLPQAWFHLLGDDGAAAAKTLVEHAFDSYVALVAAPTARIANLLGDEWDRDRAAQLQLAAAKATWTFQALIRTLDGDGVPVQATLEIGGVGFDRGERVVSRRGDAEGWVLSPLLRRDRLHHLSIVTGASRRSAIVRASASQIHKVTMIFAQQPRSAAEADVPSRPRLLGGQETFVTERRTLSELADSTPLRLVSVTDGDAMLRGVFRHVSGGTVISVRVDAPADALPDPVPAAGTVLIAEGGALRLATADEQSRISAGLGAKLAGRSTP